LRRSGFLHVPESSSLAKDRYRLNAQPIPDGKSVSVYYMAMLLTGQARNIGRDSSSSFRLLAVGSQMWRLPQQYHLVHEPVLAGEVRLRIVVEEAGSMEIHAAVRCHAAILRLDGHVAPAVDAYARVVDGIPEQHRRQRDFAHSQRARLGTQAWPSPIDTDTSVRRILDFQTALLSKSSTGRAGAICSPFYNTGTVIGVPRRVKRFRTAALTCSSAT